MQYDCVSIKGEIWTQRQTSLEEDDVKTHGEHQELGDRPRADSPSLPQKEPALPTL